MTKLRSKVEVNYEICKDLAEHLKSLSIKPFNWVVPDLYPEPTASAEKVTNYFFIVVAQDFGFWFGNKNGYDRPMYAVKNGKKLKGADFLWTTSFDMYKQNPEFFTAATMKNLSIKELEGWLNDDSGICPVPMKAERLKIARDLGKRLCKYYDGTFTSVLGSCGGFLAKKGKGLLELLDLFYGFGDSPFYKKALLLAKILCSRPEGFLIIKDKEHQKVLLDYHLARLAERTGMIDIVDPNLTRKLIRRAWVSREEEYEVRQRALEAYDIICKISEKDPFTIDDLFWEGRKYCPEMQEPECMKCLLNIKCKGSQDSRYKMLFQPVTRTITY